jgi:hypothetical protein
MFASRQDDVNRQRLELVLVEPHVLVAFVSLGCVE